MKFWPFTLSQEAIQQIMEAVSSFPSAAQIRDCGRLGAHASAPFGDDTHCGQCDSNHPVDFPNRGGNVEKYEGRISCFERRLLGFP
jgi:hypothetical protein